MAPEKLAERHFNNGHQLARSIETVLEIGKVKLSDYVRIKVFPSNPEFVETGKLILWKIENRLELHIHEPGD